MSLLRLLSWSVMYDTIRSGADRGDTAAELRVWALFAALVAVAGLGIKVAMQSFPAKVAWLTWQGIITQWRQRKLFRCDVDSLYRRQALHGRTVVVTGCNRGLGAAVARQCVREGATVVAVCRSNLTETVLHLRALSRGATVHGVEVDLSDIEQVRESAREIARFGPLDAVILNAAIVPEEARPSRYAGLEQSFVVNVLSNVVLLQALTEEVVVRRVVAISSEIHRLHNDANIMGEYRSFHGAAALEEYAASKFFLNAYMHEFARHFPSIEVCGMCPGPVATSIGRDAPPLVRPFVEWVMRQRYLFKPAFQGALPVVRLIRDTASELGVVMGRASYFFMFAHVPDDSRCSRTAVGGAVWRLSAELILTCLAQ